MVHSVEKGRLLGSSCKDGLCLSLYEATSRADDSVLLTFDATDAYSIANAPLARPSELPLERSPAVVLAQEDESTGEVYVVRARRPQPLPLVSFEIDDSEVETSVPVPPVNFDEDEEQISIGIPDDMVADDVIRSAQVFAVPEEVVVPHPPLQVIAEVVTPASSLPLPLDVALVFVAFASTSQHVAPHISSPEKVTFHAPAIISSDESAAAFERNIPHTHITDAAFVRGVRIALGHAEQGGEYSVIAYATAEQGGEETFLVASPRVILEERVEPVSLQLVPFARRTFMHENAPLSEPLFSGHGSASSAIDIRMALPVVPGVGVISRPTISDGRKTAYTIVAMRERGDSGSHQGHSSGERHPHQHSHFTADGNNSVDNSASA